MASASTGSTPPGAGALVFSGFKQAFRGVAHGVGVCNVATSDGTTSRIQRVNAFLIDLSDSTIGLTTTTTEAGEDGSNGYSLGNTVTGFMADNPSVKVAINANFTYCENMHGGIGVRYGILGYVEPDHGMSAGNDPTKPGYDPSGNGYTDPDVQDDTDAGAIALVVRDDSSGRFVASIETVTAATGLPSGAHVAVAGSAPPSTQSPPYAPRSASNGPLQLVTNGANTAWAQFSSSSTQIAARTGAGVDSTGKKLYLVVLDGLEGNAQSYGGDFCDIAQWLIKVGAYNAINLDGGGSSVVAMRTSVCDNATGTPVYTYGPPSVLNIPYGNEKAGPPACQRPVGVFLGVIADDM